MIKTLALPLTAPVPLFGRTAAASSAPRPAVKHRGVHLQHWHRWMDACPGGAQAVWMYLREDAAGRRQPGESGQLGAGTESAAGQPRALPRVRRPSPPHLSLMISPEGLLSIRVTQAAGGSRTRRRGERVSTPAGDAQPAAACCSPHLTAGSCLLHSRLTRQAHRLERIHQALLAV